MPDEFDSGIAGMGRGGKRWQMDRWLLLYVLDIISNDCVRSSKSSPARTASLESQSRVLFEQGGGAVGDWVPGWLGKLVSPPGCLGGLKLFLFFDFFGPRQPWKRIVFHLTKLICYARSNCVKWLSAALVAAVRCCCWRRCCRLPTGDCRSGIGSAC